LEIGIAPIIVQRHTESKMKLSEDCLAVEEPMEIRLDFSVEGERRQQSLSITMRTPGADFELAAGFLFTEGVIQKKQDILRISHCGPALSHLGHSNVVKVELAEGVTLNLKSLERNFYTTSSCGVCGKSSVEALKTQNPFSLRMKEEVLPLRFPKSEVPLLADRLREAQRVFDSTGGLHASGFFHSDGTLHSAREDVGRHNALDKLIGNALLAGALPLSQFLLMLSGRISFELVQKAAMAGIPIIAAVGAPSSLALELAKEMNITLLGFVRGHRFNVYNRPERLQ
jgi:FdhD protein